MRKKNTKGENELSGLIPSPGDDEVSFIGYPSYYFAPSLKAEWHGQEEQDKVLPLSLCRTQCQLNSSPGFPLSALAADLGLGCPLPGFPIWPSQRLGSCDPGISWLDMTVTLDLDLDKSFGSGSQQASCSTRDPSLAPVPRPSPPTRIGISESSS